MSINWVMLTGAGYTPLPGEQTLYTSPPRTTLSLQTHGSQPPSQQYSLQCSSGVVYLTNRRIIYLPVNPTPQFESFAVPILNVVDSRVTAPWFGANKWEASLKPVYGGGIPPQHSQLECTMQFREGGAFDFSSTFERLKERLAQAVEVARESGLATGDGSESGDARGAGGLTGVNLHNVHLEDLPAYSESGQHPIVGSPSPPVPRDSVIGASPDTPRKGSTPGMSSGPTSPQQETFSPPTEPPPGYEEVQRGSVADELERRLRNAEQEDER